MMEPRRLPFLLFLAVPLGLFAAPLCCAAGWQIREPSWELGETDLMLGERDLTIRRSTDQFHSRPASTEIRLKAGWGTRVLVARPVEPAHVINELIPSFWFRGNRPGAQMLVRVVLPRTPDPMEEGPATVLLKGPVSASTGNWEKLDFGELDRTLPELLEEEVWKLRQRFDLRVDATDAYIDRVVVNIYTGSGTSTCWIDDVHLAGAVTVGDGETALLAGTMPSIDSAYPVRQVAWEQEGLTASSERRPSLVQCVSSRVEIREAPFFASIIQSNGEPFEFLKGLGFNTVELSQTATWEQLQAAERLDMWIVCPAPLAAGAEAIGPEYDRVLAWSLDAERWLNDLNSLKSRAAEIRDADFREGRPLVAFWNTHCYEIARIVDIQGFGFDALGGSFILSQYSDWLDQRSQLSQSRLPVWATVQTAVSDSIRQQTAAMAMTVPPLPLDPSQLRFMAWEAIAGGARGLRFTSTVRLDGRDPVARLRSLTLRWLNAHLANLEPWIAGGAVVNRTASEDRGDQLTTLATPQGRLVLVQRGSGREQWAAGEAAVRNWSFSDASMATSEQAYHLSETGLVLLDSGRAVTGSEIVLENCGPVEAVLITNHGAVLNRMAQTYMSAGAQPLTQMHLEIAQQWLAITQLINEQLTRTGHGLPVASAALNEANNALQQARSLTESGSTLSANRLLHVADQKMAVARGSLLEEARRAFRSSTSSPLLTHVSLVPLHYELAARIDPSAWQPNGLPGGEFENLDQMLSGGWENLRAATGGFSTHVELASTPVVSGRSSLLMRVSASAAGGSGTLVDRPPLWIQSGSVPVSAGQLVRIHGWVNIPQFLGGSLEGLRIVDSIGGPDLCERISITQGWQEFCIYRCPTRDTDLRITFELTGEGDVYLDEVQVNALSLSSSTTRSLDGPATATDSGPAALPSSTPRNTGFRRNPR